MRAKIMQKYEDLLALIVEVKKDNTDEFMVYMKEKIDDHKKFFTVLKEMEGRSPNYKWIELAFEEFKINEFIEKKETEVSD